MVYWRLIVNSQEERNYVIRLKWSVNIERSV